MQDLVLIQNKELEEKLRIETQIVNVINVQASKLRYAVLKAKSPIIIQGGDDKTNRLAVENKKVDILLSPEKNRANDNIFFRNSGLNQVLCKLAHKNNVAIGFNFSDLLNSEGKKRAKILGRMMQNARLCKKYKVNMILATFAKDKYELRSKSILDSFKNILTKDM